MKSNEDTFHPNEVRQKKNCGGKDENKSSFNDLFVILI